METQNFPDAPRIVFHQDQDPPKVQPSEDIVHLWTPPPGKYSHQMYLLRDKTWYPVVNYG